MVRIKSLKSVKILAILITLTIGFSVVANPEHKEETKTEFNAAEYALHHALDAHEFHFTDNIVIPLPIILWTDKGFITFMSSEFHHDDNGHHVVSRDGLNFVKSHEKIYQLDAGAKHLEHNEAHEVTNAKQILFDFSLTKNVVTIFLVAFLLLFVFLKSAKFYKKEKPTAPRGIAGWMEPIILFIRDLAKENIEGDKYKKFLPYLLTVFFFILFGNLLGLIPFLANPNMTGNISITLMLAMFTFIIQLMNSRKTFWLHIFDPLGDSMKLGAKIPLYIILLPIEIIGIFIKPVALMIRLFANITAGHIIVVSLISIIFVNQSAAWAGLSVPMTLFISTLELLVAFLQAYIFTMLSALFIGMAVESSHH
jgi:F-type H+-transporting ATPase subunit a